MDSKTHPHRPGGVRARSFTCRGLNMHTDTRIMRRWREKKQPANTASP